MRACYGLQYGVPTGATSVIAARNLGTRLIGTPSPRLTDTPITSNKNTLASQTLYPRSVRDWLTLIAALSLTPGMACACLAFLGSYCGINTL